MKFTKILVTILLVFLACIAIPLTVNAAEYESDFSTSTGWSGGTISGGVLALSGSYTTSTYNTGVTGTNFYWSSKLKFISGQTITFCFNGGNGPEVQIQAWQSKITITGHSSSTKSFSSSIQDGNWHTIVYKQYNGHVYFILDGVTIDDYPYSQSLSNSQVQYYCFSGSYQFDDFYFNTDGTPKISWINKPNRVYINLDRYENGYYYPMGSVSSLNIYNYNNTAWTNITNPANTVIYDGAYDNDTIRIFASAPGYNSIEKNYTINNTVTVDDGTHSIYHYGGNTTYDGLYGYALTKFTVNESLTSFNIMGYLRDSNGYKLTDFDMYLEDYTTGDIIDYTKSGIGNSAGYYNLEMPDIADTYKVVVFCPGYGNITARTEYDGQYKNTVEYPTDLSVVSGYPEDTQYDIIVDLTDTGYTPSVTPTPSATVNPPAVTGYYTMITQVTSKNTGVNCDDVTVIFEYINGTDITTGKTDSNGYAILYVPHLPTGTTYRLMVSGNDRFTSTGLDEFYTQYVAYFMDYWATNDPLRFNLRLLAVSSANYYEIHGTIRDDLYSNIVLSNVAVSGKYSNGTSFYSTVSSNGFYSIHIPMTNPIEFYNESVGISFFNISYTLSGYQSLEIPFWYPNFFVNTGSNSVLYDVDLIPLNDDAATQARIAIITKNHDTMLAIPDVSITVYNTTNKIVTNQSVTDHWGQVIFNVDPGVYKLTIECDGYYTVVDTQTFDDIANTNIRTYELIPYIAPTVTANPCNTPTVTPIPTTTAVPMYWDAAYWGIDPAVMNLLYAFATIIIGVVLVGTFTGFATIGMLLGGFAGFLLAWGLKWIPTEWIILLVIACIAIVAFVLFVRPGGGE